MQLNILSDKDKIIKSEKKKNTTRAKWGKVIGSVLLFAFGLAMIIPFIYMIATAFKSPGEYITNPVAIIPKEIYLGNFQDVFSNSMFFKWYKNSVVVVITIIFLRVIVISAAAYAFAMLKFPFKNFLFAVIMATMFIPSDTTLVSRYFIYKGIHLTDSSLAIILPGIGDALMFFMLRQFFIKIPYELVESAQIDGCSYFKILYKIILPLAKPALTTLVLFTFIWVWNDFTNPSIFISDPTKQLLTVGVYSLTNNQGMPLTTIQLAGSVLAVIPVMILFVVTQKFFIEGVSQSGIKG